MKIKIITMCKLPVKIISDPEDMQVGLLTICERFWRGPTSRAEAK